MSSTTQATQYTYALGMDDPLGDPQIAFTLTQTASFGDSEAFAFFAALKAAVPATLLFNSSITKIESSEVVYTTDLAATPPAFE